MKDKYTKSQEAKNKESLEKLKDEFSLSQEEIHLFGELLLNRIHSRYNKLIEDPDWCWSLDEDIKLFTKLSIIVVRLQCNKKLREQ
jgi:hypothetical protein